MTHNFVSLLLLLGHFAFGQTQYSFNKIIFNYSKGHSSWNKSGIYGRSEQIEFTSTNDSTVSLTRFFNVAYSAGEDGKTFTNDTLELSIEKYIPINRRHIENWLTQLNTQKENYTKEFVKQKLTKANEKEISKAAKSIKKELFFDRNFKQQRIEIINKIKALYKIDSFLLWTKPDMKNELVVSDNWHRLKIEVVSNIDTTIYQCQFWSPLGQPISRYDNNNYSNSKRVFNLEVNTSAQVFLPKESHTYKILDINNIKEQYIKWCLEKYFY